MTSDEVQRMLRLCQRIATEKDQKKFDELVNEINDLFESKHKRLDNPQERDRKI